MSKVRLQNKRSETYRVRVVVSVRSVAVSVGCSIGMSVAVLVVVESLFMRGKVLNGTSREVTRLKLELNKK